MIRTEFTAKSEITLDTPYGDRAGALVPEKTIGGCCEFLQKQFIYHSDNKWAGEGTGTLNTHVKVTSLPPHAGDVVVEAFLYVDSPGPDLWDSLWFNRNLKNLFANDIGKVSLTYDKDVDCTLTLSAAPPPFVTNDYYSVKAA